MVEKPKKGGRHSITQKKIVPYRRSDREECGRIHKNWAKPQMVSVITDLKQTRRNLAWTRDRNGQSSWSLPGRAIMLPVAGRDGLRARRLPVEKYAVARPKNLIGQRSNAMSGRHFRRGLSKPLRFCRRQAGGVDFREMEVINSTILKGHCDSYSRDGSKKANSKRGMNPCSPGCKPDRSSRTVRIRESRGGQNREESRAGQNRNPIRGSAMTVVLGPGKGVAYSTLNRSEIVRGRRKKRRRARSSRISNPSEGTKYHNWGFRGESPLKTGKERKKRATESDARFNGATRRGTSTRERSGHRIVVWEKRESSQTEGMKNWAKERRGVAGGVFWVHAGVKVSYLFSSRCRIGGEFHGRGIGGFWDGPSIVKR